MIKVVLDANVLVSGMISRKGPPGQILDAGLEGQYCICFSPQILEELKRVLEYPRIRERLDEHEIESVLEKLCKNGQVSDGKLVLDVLTRDPADNIYIACAIEAGVDFLVTGNLDHFLEAGEVFRGVRILAPRAFLDLLEDG